MTVEPLRLRELLERLVAARTPRCTPGLFQIPSFNDLKSDANDADIGGVRVRVCSLESLLAMKRASSRARDREDLKALADAHGPPEEE